MKGWHGVLLSILVAISGQKQASCEDWPSEGLLKAIAITESQNNPYAISPKGAIGLYQLTKPVIIEYAREERGGDVYSLQLGEVRTQREIATWFLRRLRYHYLRKNYSLERVLACYNAGYERMHHVNFDLKKAPQETQEYVRRVKVEIRRIRAYE